MDEKDLKKINELFEQTGEKLMSFEKELKGKISKDDIKSLEGKFDELKGSVESLSTVEGKKLTDYVSELQKHADKLETDFKSLKESNGIKEKSLSQNIEEMVKSKEFQETVKRIKAGDKTGGTFNIKTAGTVTTAAGYMASGSGTIFLNHELEPGVAKQPWRPTPVWDSLAKGTIGAGRTNVDWYEETSRTDGASLKAEGVKFAQSDSKWTRKTANVFKLADYVKCSRESLEDWEYTQGEIYDLLMNGIPQVRENQMLNGAGTTEFDGLITIAKTYSANPTGYEKVVKANTLDVINAMVLKVNLGDTADAKKGGYNPNVVFVHPTTITNMKGEKDTDGNYLFNPYFTNTGEIQLGSLRIVPSFYITAGDILVCDSTRAKAFIKRDMEIRMFDQNEDDALYDTITFTATQRLAMRVKDVEKFAFAKGTIASVKALITAA